MTDLDIFVALTREKKLLKSWADDVNQRLRDLEQQLLDEFADEGVLKKGTVGGATVSIRTQLRARYLGEKADAARVLASTPGLEHIVEETFNLNTLAAHFAQIHRDNPDVSVDLLLPDPLFDVIKLYEDPKLGVTNARK